MCVGAFRQLYYAIAAECVHVLAGYVAAICGPFVFDKFCGCCCKTCVSFNNFGKTFTITWYNEKEYKQTC